MTLPDDINIDCPYQQQGMGTLICKAAVINVINGKYTTNEVNSEDCSECPVGKIYRELGCNKISAKLHVILIGAGKHELVPEKIWCSLRKRPTDYNYCLTCPYVGAQFTKPIMKKVMDFFDRLGFEAAKKHLTKAQERLHKGDPKNAITNSISALESVFKSVLDLLKVRHPPKKGLASLWRAVETNLKLGDEIASKHLTQVIGSLSGTLDGLGGLRNDLSDAHGKGLISPEVYDSYAELAVNLSASICLFVIRRYQELDKGK